MHLRLAGYRGRCFTDYYERDRVDLFRQGDLFRDVPLAYPLPSGRTHCRRGERRHSPLSVSGPLESGPAMLITPSCSPGAQGGGGGYAHPLRTLVPVLRLDQFVERGSSGGHSRRSATVRPPDQLHVPAAARRRQLRFSRPESPALLYMLVTLHHAGPDGLRVSQLA